MGWLVVISLFVFKGNGKGKGKGNKLNGFNFSPPLFIIL